MNCPNCGKFISSFNSMRRASNGRTWTKINCRSCGYNASGPDGDIKPRFPFGIHPKEKK